jgi:GNAT superfamily N-acetyltransferase
MFHLRPATLADVPALEPLIAFSALALSAGFYSGRQAESALRYIFGPDTQLIRDGTYFVAISQEEGGAKRLIGCGGWSRRRTLFGGDQAKEAEDPLLDPTCDPARIRAFFVDPGWARRGVGRAILDACTAAARQAGFRSLELVATLPGEPLYRAGGFEVVERFELLLPDGVQLPVARMAKPLDPN